MEEVKLDLIRVESCSHSIFKFLLLYRDRGATGLARVYSYDDNWYYLYNGFLEKVRVKRCKDLESQKPYVLYPTAREVDSTDNDGYSTVQFEKGKVVEFRSNGDLFMERNLNEEIQKYFGNRFIATSERSRFEVMIEYYSNKFLITEGQAKEAYDKTCKLQQEGKIEKFAGYFAALCKSMSNKEYTPEQEYRYIKINIKNRKNEQLFDFIQRYEAGERRVFAPGYGITKKDHNDIAYHVAKQELEARSSRLKTRGKNPDRSMCSP